jgi:hypothetical protein
MLIHRQPVDRAECPGFRFIDGSARLELPPKAEEDILNGVSGLRVAEAEAPDEAEERLAVATLQIENDRLEGLCVEEDPDGGWLARLHLGQCERLNDGFNAEQSGHTPSTQAQRTLRPATRCSQSRPTTASC